MASEANEPGSESGKRSDDRRGVPEGTPQEGGASTPLAAPRIVRRSRHDYSDSLLGAVRVPSAGAVLVELLVEMEALEHELDGRGHEARALEGAELGHGLAEPGDLADALEVLLGAHAVGGLHAPARLEVLGHLLQPLDLQALVPHLEHRAVDEP